MPWGPRLCQSEGGPLANAPGPSVVPKRRTPSGPCDGGLGGPKAKEAASPIPKRRRPPRPCGGGLGGPKAKEAPPPMR